MMARTHHPQWPRRSRELAGVFLVLAVAACGEAPPAPGAPITQPSIRVAAAASLTDVLEPIAASFERTSGTHVELRFGGSSTLARQIQEGAPTDVFVSADPRWVTELAAIADVATRRTVATNRLVVIVPSTALDTPTDLAALVPLAHVALAGPEVPAGAHARRALERAGVLDALEPRVASAPDVRAAMGWVALGEADAALVYATDARVEPRVRVAFALDPASDDPIRYEAVVTDGAEPEAAAAFVVFLLGPEARRDLDDAGFGPAP